jgi:hypothetical protein
VPNGATEVVSGHRHGRVDPVFTLTPTDAAFVDPGRGTITVDVEAELANLPDALAEPEDLGVPGQQPARGTAVVASGK